MSAKLSAYAVDLKGVAKARYIQKLAISDLQTDPYVIDKKDLEDSPKEIPNVEWHDMYLYMISTPSQHTREEIRAWKSMIGSDSFVKAGWVHDMQLYSYKSEGRQRYVVIGNVKHSQRMSATPLLPWFAVDKSGEILAAHCTCMAGLGEACSHIAALVSSVMKANEQRKTPGEDACTSKSCVWLPANRNVVAAKVENINFSKPSSCNKRQKKASTGTVQHVITPPTVEELAAFHASLVQAPTRPVLHRVMDEYAHEFVPLSSTDKFTPLMSTLYDPDSLRLTYAELLENCANLADSLYVTSDQCRSVEEATRGQASSKLWFSQRAGRITASIFKSAARTNPAMPSPSLIKRICYPEAFKFSTEATRWGCDHEKYALGMYLKQEGPNHQNLVARDCGLLINPNYPFIGATPDAILQCECCEPRLAEIKCPFCAKDGLNTYLSEQNCQNFCLTNHGTLKKDHNYFFQVQAQLNVWEIETCIFILWTKKDVFSERINRDRVFFQSELDRVHHFFVTGVLPELVGKWASRKPVQSTGGNVEALKPVCVASQKEDDANKLWCYCEKPSFGQMIACDNKSCAIEWFHMDCLLMRVPPKGKWYCPHCRKLTKFARGKKNEQ